MPEWAGSGSKQANSSVSDSGNIFSSQTLSFMLHQVTSFCEKAFGFTAEGAKTELAAFLPTTRTSACEARQEAGTPWGC